MAIRRAYSRACRKEEHRQLNWPQTVARRRANILRLLADLTAARPITADLSKEQQAAARLLHTIADTPPMNSDDFYNHILELQRRRAERKKQQPL